MRASNDRPVNDPLSRAGYVQKASIDDNTRRLLMAYPGYGRQPGESAEEVRKGSRARSQWHQEAGVWRNAPLGPAEAIPLRVVALSQQYASGLFAIHPSGNWIVSYYASGGTTTLYAHPVDWSGADPVFGTPVTLGIADAGFLVGATAINFDSTGAWLILTGPWTAHTLRTFSFDGPAGTDTGAMALVQDVGSGTFPQTLLATMCACPDSHLAVSVYSGGEVRIYHFDNTTGNVTTTPVATLTGTTAKWSLRWGPDYTHPSGGGDTEYLYLGEDELAEIFPFDRSAETAGTAIPLPNLPYMPSSRWVMERHGGELTLLVSIDTDGAASAYWTWDFNPATGVVTGPFYNILSPISSAYRLLSTRFDFTAAAFIASGVSQIVFVKVDLLSREITFTAYAEPSTPQTATRDFSGYLVRANVGAGNKLEILSSFLP